MSSQVLVPFVFEHDRIVEDPETTLSIEKKMYWPKILRKLNQFKIVNKPWTNICFIQYAVPLNIFFFIDPQQDNFLITEKAIPLT